MNCLRNAVFLTAVLAAAAVAADGLDTARAEPNLEKRSKLALDNADNALKEARDAYRDGDTVKAETAAAEIEASVDLAYNSLVDTGKNPRKSPKWFKYAEMQTRELGRRLEDFQHQMSFADRAAFDPVKAKVQQIHEDLLMGLMEGRKRKRE